jgi:hypothetical protein
MEVLQGRNDSPERTRFRSLGSRWVRVPIFVVGTFALTIGAAIWFQARWLSFCEHFKNEGELPCQPIGDLRMVAYFTIGLGVVTMIVGPMVNTLYRLARYGQPWETTRHETAASNIPILAGLFYLALGTVLFLT